VILAGIAAIFDIDGRGIKEDAEARGKAEKPVG
jgi:hypothetical protein